MPLLHEYLFLIRHCWTVLCDERHHSLIFFAFLLKSKLSVLKFYLWECWHIQSFWISSVDKFCSKMLDSGPELEFVRRSLNASPLMKPFLTAKEMLVLKCCSIGLKCVFISNIESFVNRSPLKTYVSRNVVSVYEMSAVNFIVKWWLFVFSINCVTSALFVCQIENKSSIYLFQTSGLRALRLRISVSTAAIKLPVGGKSSREVSSSSDDISARYSLPQNFQSSEHRKLTKGKQSFTRFTTSQQRNFLPVFRDTNMWNFHYFRWPKQSFSLLFDK